MKVKQFKLLFLTCFIFSSSVYGAIFKPRTKAKQAILIAVESGSVLYEKNSQQKMTPSSMTKVMTTYLIFEALQQKFLKLDQKYLVSQKARRQGGSRMFLEQGSNVTIEELLKGTIVSSGNDATVTLAEGFAGTEETFAHAMTEKARSIGAKNTVFLNSNGWPTRGHYSTAKDLATIAVSLIKNFPKLYNKYYYLYEYKYNNIKQYSHNVLLKNLQEDYRVDGMKTGHTQKGGYGIILSAVKPGPNPTRIICVLNGFKSEAERAREARALLQWAFNQHRTNKLMTKNKVYFNLPFENSETKEAEVVTPKDVYFTSHHSKAKRLKFKLESLKKSAPLAKGTHVANLHVEGTLKENFVIPLYTKTEVRESGLFRRMFNRVKGYFVSQKRVEYKELVTKITSSLLKEENKTRL